MSFWGITGGYDYVQAECRVASMLDETSGSRPRVVWLDGWWNRHVLSDFRLAQRSTFFGFCILSFKPYGGVLKYGYPKSSSIVFLDVLLSTIELMGYPHSWIPQCGGFLEFGYPKMMVSNGNPENKMDDDLGYPYFLETSIYVPDISHSIISPHYIAMYFPYTLWFSMIFPYW